MEKLFLDGSKMTSKENAHQYIKNAFHFPDFYGENLDALWDLLIANNKAVSIFISNEEELYEHLGEYGKLMIETIQEAASSNDTIQVFIMEEERSMDNLELLNVLKIRFEANRSRHENIEWAKVQSKLEANSEKLWSLNEMERTGGEPDVVGQDETTEEYIFCDCSPESPEGRRNICYDYEGQAKREKKGVFPEGNAIDMAAAMGIEILTEEEYRELQKLWKFDRKTSSWVKTPSDIRKLGGAIFADRRYEHVFIYHNSAHSFYSSRGFRGLLRV